MAQTNFQVTKNDDGSFTSTSTFDATSINWAVIIKAVQAAIPVILSIIAAFGSAPVPPAGKDVKP